MMDGLLESIDYRRYAILYVDDEERSLKYFRQAFEDSFEIYTARNAAEGYSILCERRDQIGVLLTDQRMPGESGVELLDKARRLDPHILRILVTAYSDVETAIDSVNTGAVFHYLTKPWDPEILEGMLKRCLEYFAVQSQRDHLLHEKLGIVQNMLRGDRAESMSILASGLNHHMRNALTSIKTFVDLVPFKLRQELGEREDYQDGEFWTRYHGEVEQQVQRMIAILERLWDASCEKELHFEPGVDLREAVTTTLTVMEVELAQREIDIELSIPADLPALTSNRAKLDQFLRLLLQDALTHLGGAKRIYLGASMVDGYSGDVNMPCVHLWISDDGEPVDESALDHLFDPFFQRGTDPRSLGTDLMACYHIVHLHGGRIEARNDHDGNTAIHLYLPLERAGAFAGAMGENDLQSRIAATEDLWNSLQRG
jgi:signal transduction histidine kinase